MKKLMLVILGLIVVFALLAIAQDTSSSSSSGNSASEQKAPELKTLTGYVSDEKCGAKGAGEGKAACAEKCVKGGSKIVFVNDADHKVWNVKNPDDLKDHVGHHVELSAHVYDDGSIHVMSTKMAPEEKKAS